jgi:hypothetical protein
MVVKIKLILGGRNDSILCFGSLEEEADCGYFSAVLLAGTYFQHSLCSRPLWTLLAR